MIDDVQANAIQDQAPTPEASRFLAALQMMQANANHANAVAQGAPATPPVLPPAAQAYLNQTAPAPQQIAQNAPPEAPLGAPAPQASAPAPAEPGPIKKHLTNFLYGLQEGALRNAGLPTQYDRQQNAAHLALEQKTQQSLEDYRKTEGGRIDAQTTAITQGNDPFTIPNQPMFGSFAGQTLPRNAANAIMQKMATLANAKDIASGNNATTLQGKEIQYGKDSYLRHGFKDVGGRSVMYDKQTGETIKDMGPSNSLVVGASNADARAKASAKYRTFDTIDANGFPVTISGLDALEQGAPKVGFNAAKGISSDLVGINQYRDILDKKISPNLAALQDNEQRAIIAHTLEEADKNPGMFQSILTSAMQQGGLTPQGAQLAAGIMQGREFGGVARKYGGNMNGTEGLMNRIMANQASPLNGEQLNRELIQNDREFTEKALTSLGGITSHRSSAAGKGTSPTANTGNSPATPASSFFQQFGGKSR